MTPTFGTLFSGGELAGVGIQAAGWRHVWGVEYDPAIAAVAARNGFNVTVADVLDCDPRDFAPVDALHASPVCTRASVANNSAEVNDEGTKEAPLDIAMGAKVAEFIDVLAPGVVTIENVYAYRNFKAFGKITAALDRGGYFWDYSHENAADYGVPQTRRRLILRAVHGRLLPHLPPPVPWVGWYAAIEDLIPTLPESKFADWQLARLPEDMQDILIGGANRSESFLQFAKEHRKTIPGQFERQEPAPTLAATSSSDMRAFLVSNAKTEYSDGVRHAVEPALAVTGQSVGRTRAFIVDDQNNGTPDADGERGLTVPHGQAPMFTVSATQNKRSIRAFLVNTREMHGNEEGSNAYTAVDADTPSYTVAASSAPSRHRAWLAAGRVVAMTPRALARFQSLPDWYALPTDDNPKAGTLACKIIGNGVPCLMMQRIYEGLTP